MEEQKHRPHRARRDKKGKGRARAEGQRNPKAFAFRSGVRAATAGRRNAQLEQHRLHVPAIDRTFGTPGSSTLPDASPPPVIVAIYGPNGVGKSTLLRSLVRRYTKTSMPDIRGPATVVSGKTRRLTFIEVPNEIGALVDVAKVADLVLMVIDGSFGFEMETFEAVTALQSHGMPKVMAVLTHLDLIKKPEALKAQKKRLKHRFWTELYDGAKMFYISGVWNGRYPDREVLNLSRYINTAKFRPLTWRNQHSYILADHLEDVTPRETIRKNPKSDRVVAISGYLRGLPLRPPASPAEPLRVHIPGTGLDLFEVAKLSGLTDPCPLPTAEGEKRRKLSEKHRTLHAPLSGSAGGGVFYDGDKLWINAVADAGRRGALSTSIGEGERMILDMQEAPSTLDDAVNNATLNLFREPGLGVEAGPSSRDPSTMHFTSDEPTMSSPTRLLRRTVPEEKLSEAGISSGEAEVIDSDSELGQFDDDHSASVTEVHEGHWREDLPGLARRHFASAVAKRQKYLSRSIYDSTDTATEDPISAVSTLAGHSEGDVDLTLRVTSTLAEPEDLFRPRLVCELHTEESFARMKPFFITGDQTHSEEVTHPDQQSSEQGDFEDLDELRQASAEDSKRDPLAIKKAALKRKFDQQYDGGASDPEITTDFFAEQKESMMRRFAATNAAFEGQDSAARVQLEGFPSGTYVRLELQQVPCELVEHFDARIPLIVGALLEHEETSAFVQVRLKKHRWHHKILKTNDPIILSVGWRRFQTTPVYSLDDGSKNRMLKYTPEHMHCLATYWGPQVAPGSGLCAMSSLSMSTPSFRMSATGVVVDLDRSCRIVKKLKLTGTPFKIYKNTAYIKGMFNSSLEIAKFEGAHLRTVSGIRGQVKRPLAKPEGCFRAVFEDRVLSSDIVFLRTWTQIEPRKYCSPVANLLSTDKRSWVGMRNTGTVRAELGLSIPSRINSLYKAVDRETRRFNPLKISQKLQSALPFTSKPKIQRAQTHPTYMQQRAVLMEPEEKRAIGLLQQIQAIEKVKVAKRRQKKHEQQELRRKAAAVKDQLRGERERSERREYFREQALAERGKRGV